MNSFIWKGPWLLSIIHGANGAGMTSHNIAALRASQFEYFGPETDLFHSQDFYGLAESRIDAIQAGSPFPDYLYACGTEHDAGEEAHWTPFQIASVDYIRKTYPNWATDGRESDGAGLVAFTFGVTSHYITDINWHGLEVIPSGEGLIRTMGYADFNCTDGDLCGVAHSAADTGGEFAGAASLDLSWYPAADWFMPTTDLVNIYTEMNATGQGPLVEPEWINACAIIFYAGSFGVSRFGDLIYPLLAPSTGGLLWDNYFDFPVGGIDDNAAWTSFMWNRLADWLVYGPPPPDPPPNSRRLTNKYRQITLDAKQKWVQAARNILSSQNITSDDQLFQIYDISANGNIQSSTGSFIGLKRVLTEMSFDEKIAAVKMDAHLLEMLANSLIDNYLVHVFPSLLQVNSITTIQEVRAKITERANEISHARYFVESNISKTFTEDVDVKLPLRPLGSGVTSRQYYATSLTPSISGNGIMIGSPGSGRVGGPQEGTAQLFFEGNTKSTVTFSGGRGGGDTTSFPSYERFGWATASCDINDDQIEDWIICAPSYAGGRDTEAAHGNYTGRCDIFFGPFKSDLLEPNGPVPDASIYGDRIWGNFGMSVVTGDVDGDGRSDIVISAPFAGSYPDVAPNDRGDLSSQGAVYIYLASSFSTTISSSSNKLQLVASTSADILLQQIDSFQWFGKSLAIHSNIDGAPILVVGSPTFHSKIAGEESSAVGKIYFYRINQQKQVTLIHSLTGCVHAGRTGYSFALSDTHFAFSEPYWSATSDTNEQRPRDQLLRSGRVFVTKWQEILSSSTELDVRVCELPSSSFIEARGDSFESRFGLTLLFSSDSQLIIGAPLANDGQGEVYKMDITTGELELLVKGSKQSTYYKPRYGQSLATINNNIYVGAPFATVNDLEQVGILIRV